MKLFTAFVLISFFSVKDFICDAKSRHRGRNSRRSRSQPLTNLTAPSTGQEVRLIHSPDDDDITSGTVEVLVRDAFGIVCKNRWALKDADVFCKQMGFLSGAKSVKIVRRDRGIHTIFVLDNVSCDRDSRRIQDCDWSNPGHCGTSLIAGVVCNKNIGCPEGWIAGPTGCYQVLPGTVSKQEFAVNKCIARGGHLVTIETELENHFISNAFWNFTNGPIMTGGVQLEGRWMWERITNYTEGRQTAYIPIEDSLWFPGWQPGNISPQPTKKKKDRCLFLSNNFQTPNGTNVDVDYHFWLNDRCGSTRKRNSDGFHYMCERPIERREDSIGCMIGIGAQYRGKASHTVKGTPCMKWTESTDINPETYPDTGLGDHNYCRNPDNDDSPWCWVSDGEFEFCDIPQCLDTDENLTNQQLADNETCKEDEFTCHDKRCVLSNWICDMENDCINGEDEQQNCDYMLPHFKVSEGYSVNGHVIETYAGATNESCAQHCLNSTRFVCKAFSFSSFTRVCKLTDKNTGDLEFRSSRRENVFELISQLAACSGMFQCDNGRCINNDNVCDGHDECGDFSDEADCENCFNIASNYTGRTSVTSSGYTCQQWSLNTPHKHKYSLSDNLFPDGSVVAAVNHCRAPDGDDTAWCYTTNPDVRWEFCDISPCSGQDTLSVRLAGGTDLAGRVEVFYKGEWGLICDDHWDRNDATVVCRMLGYSGEARAVSRSSYGGGSGKFLLDEVDCTGMEESIDQCDHAGWKNHDCYSWEVASVQCSDESYVEPQCKDITKEFKCPVDHTCISLNEVCDGKCQCDNCTDEENCVTHVELIGGNNPYEGRVEIILNGIRGTICDDNFDDGDAHVICRMLGFSSGVTANSGMFGQGNGTIWMDEVTCHGNETDIIGQCLHYGPRDQNCGHDEDVGVICMADTGSVSVRLEQGATPYTGRVVLTRDGENGTICDDNWDDNDAKVICRMLGFSGGTALDGEYYGPGSQYMYLHIFLDNVECTGDEDNIEKCTHDDWLVHNCDHDEDAAVKCTVPEDHMETTTVAMDTTTTQGQITVTTDCQQRNAPYIGQIAVTENGFDCQPWTLNTPHSHKHHNDSTYPDGSVAAAKNYCRSPDGDAQPWCYTTHPDERWGYCSIPVCKENCFNIASNYTGPTSVTSSGYTCQQWSLNTPHKHKYYLSDNLFPDGSVVGAVNHCRAPDGDDTAWCYTTNPDVRWEFCDISPCSGHFDFGASCGQRPLEISRARRDVDDDLDDSNDLEDDDLDDLSDLDLLPYTKLGRIYGGSVASYGMYPWQVGIKYRMSSILSYHLHKCGGTIIGEYWVLSAAHCFRDLSKGQVVVRTGDLNTKHLDKYEQEFDVEAVYPHDDYNSFSFDNDIALVKLRPVRGRGIVFSEYVQPACLPNETTKYQPGQKCLISGWGESEDTTMNSYLRAARIPIVDSHVCDRLYKGTLTPRMACAGYLAGGTDTCAGDSGGPLVCNINDHYTVMGVVSFGEGCAMPNSPGVYARVSSFIPWINKILSQ